ncbi:MAG: hypothetical protein MPJ78_01290 [Hyphomicrobiaceae bacterium]|nr:hypothetical protein [Hyphomicrobiaceae bacterium]
MEFPRNPIQFLDDIVSRHKLWLRNRAIASETLVYMGENVDQVGRGLDFIRHYVFNDKATQKDPTAPGTDLALLQLYEHWRNRHGMRPIEPWDGTRLRPWLPAEANPKVPAILDGALSELHLASYRNQTWEDHLKARGIEGPAVIDVLGNAIESYYDAIRKFDVWSMPRFWNAGGADGGHAGHGSGVGPMRLYRHNDFNNIEVAPYSIRFWGFLKWVESLRRRLLKEPDQAYRHDGDSDISFMDRFNLDHFPWHDDVFNNGVCPEWNHQFGLRKHHKYKTTEQGYGLEFLEFHSDLMRAYNVWLDRMGYLPTSEWREGNQPFVPGVHHSGYILRTAFSPHSPDNPWGRGHSNGEGIKYYIWGKDLFDPDLTKFETVAELGYFFEGFRFIHGFGHVEHCDFRDQYLNNYSLRFFHWHQWIDDIYDRARHLGLPLTKKGTTFETPMEEIVDASKFSPKPEAQLPLTGKWRYRSYHNDRQDDDQKALWFAADLTLTELPNGNLEGLLDSGHSDYRYNVSGRVDHRNIRHETEPDWYEDRSIIVMTAKGATDATKGHVYEYRGHLAPIWPDGEGQIRSFTGTVSRSTRPDDRSKEGTIGSFVATMLEEEPLVS